ncbi:hypothetical protein EMPS_09251 [Entomortierella parvispora]|uniref:Thioesterase domain-containing protein n=1 Tax=Entomortierella parvispora TaxID=205924 RepID=A0A9P3HIF6_9FUNG|nr:hypothetical protein EMPS_09251 [Entomortierella parvispora]
MLKTVPSQPLNRVARCLVVSARSRSTTPLQHPRRSGLYSTSSHNASTTNTVSPPSHQSGGDPSSPPTATGGSFSRWIQRFTLMSTSAAFGAFAYSKMDPASMGGFSTMPVGKMQPTILGTEAPDQPFPSSNNKPTPEKAEELKRSVVLQREMMELDLVHEYKVKVKDGEWKEADPYWYLTKVTEPHHLTAGTLRGENMLSVHPLKFERKDKKAIVLFMHLGRSLCGHDRIIHGGLLATLLDEATGMVALPNLPYHIGFTANLNVNYRKPVKADQFVMVKAEFENIEGRKGYTIASIHDLHGNTLVECSALYISPKNPIGMVANYVKNSLGLNGSS